MGRHHKNDLQQFHYFFITKIFTNAWFIRHLKNKNKSSVCDYGFSIYAIFFEQIESRGLAQDFSRQVIFSIYISPIPFPAWVLFLYPSLTSPQHYCSFYPVEIFPMYVLRFSLDLVLAFSSPS